MCFHLSINKADIRMGVSQPESAGDQLLPPATPSEMGVVPAALPGGPGPVTRPAAASGESAVVLLRAQNIGMPVASTGFVSCAPLAGSLVDSSGHILIPGIYDQVAPVTEEERKMYKAIDLDLEEYRNSSQVKRFLFDTKVWSQVGGSSERGVTVINPIFPILHLLWPRICTPQN